METGVRNQIRTRLHSIAFTICCSSTGPLNSDACAIAYRIPVPTNVGLDPFKHARTSYGLSGFRSRSSAQSR